jgi:pyruvate dehydrogenase E1 component alpha subunit
MATNPFPLSREDLLKTYRTMKTIREFEERLHVEFAKGDIPASCTSMPARKRPRPAS